MKKRILICEDDEGISEVLKIMLEEEGYDVLHVASGKGIGKTIEQFSPNLLLLDVLMSGISGKETALNLKKNSGTRDLPIVLISAVSDLEKISQDLGAVDYIRKPFKMDTLLKVVKKRIKNGNR